MTVSFAKICVSILIVLSNLLGTAGFAADPAPMEAFITFEGVNYNAYEYNQIVVFLKQNAGKYSNMEPGEKRLTNAQVFKTSLDTPAQWPVTWNEETPKRVTEMDLVGYSGLFGYYARGSVSVKNFTKLTRLRAGKLTSLNIEGCTALETLEFTLGTVKKLDVTKCPNLTKLDCWSNKIKVLDVSKNPKLTVLNCSGNKLQKLDVSKNKKLVKLHCGANKLEKINVSKNAKLKQLNVSCTNIKTLNLDKKKLQSLYCYETKIQKLDIKNKLYNFVCEEGTYPPPKAPTIKLKSIAVKMATSKETSDTVSVKKIALKAKGQGYVTFCGVNIDVDSDDVFNYDNIYAYPAKGYKFVNWTTKSGKVYSTDSRTSIRKNKAYTLTANFVKK